MPDDHDYEDPEAEQEGQGESSVIRDLRKRAKRVDEAEARADALAKENVLLKSGLNLDDDKRDALLALVSEPTVDAFKAKATALGWYEAPKEEPQVPSEEQEALQRVQDATGAAQPADGAPESLEARMRKAAEKGEAALDAFLANEGIGVNAEQ